jgi:protein SCO1/2
MKRLSILTAVLLLLTAAGASAADATGAAHYFAKLALIDQNGKRVDLYEDLMKGHTVVINSFFASCTGSCPVMGKTFLHLQNKLGDRVGKDVILVSISVDPARDTPEKLKEYAKRIGAKQGWYFLTGTKEETGAALRKLGQFTDVPEGHMNVIVIGNDRTGLWKKAQGIASADDVYTVVASVVDDQGAPATGGR